MGEDRVDLSWNEMDRQVDRQASRKTDSRQIKERLCACVFLIALECNVNCLWKIMVKVRSV